MNESPKQRRSRISMTEYSRESIFIRSARDMLGLSREDLAKITGVKQRTIVYWECNEPIRYSVDRHSVVKMLEKMLGEKRKEDIERYIDGIKKNSEPTSDIKKE